MSSRLKLTVAYDGAAFAGWQSQAHGHTAQDQLDRALHKISGQRVRVHGAGRTDTGVHALAQCAHVDLTDRRLSVEGLARALNAILPPSIRVLDCRSVPENFHARFSAIGKLYRYRIWTGPILPPLEVDRAWHIPSPLDLDLLSAAEGNSVATHDFAAFAASRGGKEKDTFRKIGSVRVGNSDRPSKLESPATVPTGFFVNCIFVSSSSPEQQSASSSSFFWSAFFCW